VKNITINADLEYQSYALSKKMKVKGYILTPSNDEKREIKIESRHLYKSINR
jgi:hypothetical protein